MRQLTWARIENCSYDTKDLSKISSYSTRNKINYLIIAIEAIQISLFACEKTESEKM